MASLGIYIADIGYHSWRMFTTCGKGKEHDWEVQGDCATGNQYTVCTVVHVYIDIHVCFVLNIVLSFSVVLL